MDSTWTFLPLYMWQVPSMKWYNEHVLFYYGAA